MNEYLSRLEQLSQRISNERHDWQRQIRYADDNECADCYSDAVEDVLVTIEDIHRELERIILTLRDDLQQQAPPPEIAPGQLSLFEE